ncbi:MAG: glycine zipper 2TM domain-containing protein [Steroidobacteraceae bacterium]
MRSNNVKWITLLAAAGTTLAAQAALADHGRRDGWRPGPADDADMARVIDVEPLRRRVRVTEPRRECFEETRYDEPRYRDRAEPRQAAGSMILGGIIGAAIGNQFGRGDGRRAATVAGALIGSAIGHDNAAQREARYGRIDDRRYESRPYTVQHCDVRYSERWEERIEGYHVTYEYGGRRYETELPYDPGPQLRVRVAVSPDED